MPLRYLAIATDRTCHNGADHTPEFPLMLSVEEAAKEIDGGDLGSYQITKVVAFDLDAGTITDVSKAVAEAIACQADEDGREPYPEAIAFCKRHNVTWLDSDAISRRDAVYYRDTQDDIAAYHSRVL